MSAGVRFVIGTAPARRRCPACGAHPLTPCKTRRSGTTKASVHHARLFSTTDEGITS